jgi:hypothetical protein
MRSACAGEPFYREHEGKRYCVLHFPGAGKSAAFAEALRRKRDAEDFDFKGVWFPDSLDFSDYTFGAAANFSSAKFSAAANFSSAKFSEEANFSSAKFGAAANFRSAKFGAAANFFCAKFGAAADFSSAEFSAAAIFSSATFGAAAEFFSAIFKDYVRFAGGEGKSGFSDQSSLTLEDASIEKPERVSFHTLALRPHWFINVDARKFDFTNVKWPDLERHGLRQRDGIEQVIENVEGEGSSSHILLAGACRHLAVNAEENHRYEEAAQFRYWAMDVRRRERWRGLAFWRLSWWYWVASGYGVRIFRAFLVLLGIWLVFAWLYTQVSFAHPPTTLTDESSAASARWIKFDELRGMPNALDYSFRVITLQKPEPQPETVEAKAFVAVETVFGPLQAALLALAIRRKFMR